MDSETRNLQNDFFNAARKERTLVTVFLANGKKLVGRIKSFDKFTLLLEGHHGDQIIFKHAVSTISTGNSHASGGPGSTQTGRREPSHAGATGERS